MSEARELLAAEYEHPANREYIISAPWESLSDRDQKALRAISTARRQAIEECARIAECHADDRAGRDRPLDWHDGYMDACRGAGAAIRSLLKETPDA